MNSKSLLLVQLVTLTVGAGLWVIPATAEQITFDSLAADSESTTYVGNQDFRNSFVVDGFKFLLGQDNTAVITLGGTNGSPELPLNGSNYLFSQDGGRFTAVTLSQLDGAPFSLSSFDAAGSFMGLDFQAANIDVVGTIVGGGNVSTSVQLGNSGVDFQTFQLPSSFTNLVSVTFNGSGGVHNGPTFFRQDFSLDNLVVPEPSTFVLGALSAMSLAAFGGRLRRKRIATLSA